MKEVKPYRIYESLFQAGLGKRASPFIVHYDTIDQFEHERRYFRQGIRRLFHGRVSTKIESHYEAFVPTGEERKLVIVE